MTLRNHPRIAIDPAVCHGKPVIAGTRIIVSELLGALAAGEEHRDLIEDYPSLSEDDITAALAFASDLSGFESVS